MKIQNTQCYYVLTTGNGNIESTVKFTIALSLYTCLKYLYKVRFVYNALE